MRIIDDRRESALLISCCVLQYVRYVVAVRKDPIPRVAHLRSQLVTLKGAFAFSKYCLLSDRVGQQAIGNADKGV